MAGKRHSVADMKHIQGMHDSATELGAACNWSRVAWPTFSESLKEASLPLTDSHSALRDRVSQALQLALGVTDTWTSRGPYVLDMFGSDVVYSVAGVKYRRSYSDQGKAVTFGMPKIVNLAYVDASATAKESLGLLNPEVVEAAEADPSVIITPGADELVVRESLSFGAEGLKVMESAAMPAVPIKLISAGWGSSGYYSKDMLKRDGAKAFKAGTQMHWNHATAAEEKARPEGSLNTLAGILKEDAKWDDNGFDGPGLYSTAKVFSDHAQQLKEKGAYIGTSIKAAATKITEGEAEGKKGRIIEGLAESKFNQADFVTRAGAGGKPLVREGAVERPDEPQIQEQESTTMTEQEQTTLREAQAGREKAEKDLKEALAATAKLKQENNNALAMGAYIAAFAAKGVQVEESAIKVLAANPPLKENGDVDLDGIKKIAEGFKITGKAAPKAGVRNLGESAAVDTQVKEGADDPEMVDIFKGFGLKEAAAKVAANGRV